MPGETTFTVMPHFPNSIANDCVKEVTAALVAAYSEYLASPRTPTIEEVLTIRPSPRFFISLPAYLQHVIVPIKFVSITDLTTSMDCSSSPAILSREPPPATLTK
ncbi:hypothetical protein IMSAGC004_02560 [Bacteroidaceae bacterium]|nr:hypothetical protein IMSAGC004_02560 [Bacteroidaceae bacterium]